MKSTRREFLKSCAMTTVGMGAARKILATTPTKTNKATEQPTSPAISAGEEFSLCWHGYRWIAKGNVLRWMNFKPSSDCKHSVLDEYGLQVLSATDICAGLCVFRDSLIWIGEHGHIYTVRPVDAWRTFEFSLISTSGEWKQHWNGVYWE